MTDQNPSDHPDESAQPHPAAGGDHGPQTNGGSEPLDRAKQVAGDAMKKLSNAEQLIALGALLIVFISDFIGNVLLDNYSPERTLLAVAFAALLLIWAMRFSAHEQPHVAGWLLKGGGYLGGLLGARQLLADIESNNYDGGSILFALLLYVGAGLMAIGAGAIQVKPQDRPPA